MTERDKRIERKAERLVSMLRGEMALEGQALPDSETERLREKCRKMLSDDRLNDLASKFDSESWNQKD